MAATVPSPRTKLIDFSALWAWLITCIVMAALSYILFGQDFRGYYAAARVLLAGGNPYDYNQLAPVLQSITGWMGNNPYYYPPWFAWFFIPFTVLPFEAARIAWMIANLAAWILGLWQLGKLLNWPKKGWQRWLFFLLLTYLFAWITWRYEQIGIILFCLLVSTLIAIRRRNWPLTGIILALLLIKPNVMLIPLVALSIWLIKQGKWQPVVIMIGTIAGLFLVSTLATPDWYQPLLKPGFGSGLTNELDGPGKIVATRLNSTILDFLAWLHINGGIRMGIYVVATITALGILGLCICRSSSLLQVTAMALIVSYAITPYDVQYDFPPLAFALSWCLAITLSNWQPRLHWVSITMCIFIFSIPFWERPVSEAYFIVLAIAVLLGLTFRAIPRIELPQNLQ
jgi:hypothetical protein